LFATWWLGATLLQIGKKELESNSFWALETSGKMVNFCLDSHSSLWYYVGADKSADLKGAVFAKIYLADNGCLWHCWSALADVKVSRRHFESVAVSPTAHLNN
jgi:hypothetical protein